MTKRRAVKGLPAPLYDTPFLLAQYIADVIFHKSNFA